VPATTTSSGADRGELRQQLGADRILGQHHQLHTPRPAALEHRAELEHQTAVVLASDPRAQLLERLDQLGRNQAARRQQAAGRVQLEQRIFERRVPVDQRGRMKIDLHDRRGCDSRAQHTEFGRFWGTVAPPMDLTTTARSGRSEREVIANCEPSTSSWST
jgi:hypothetical protein